jgi:hypothetical protein
MELIPPIMDPTAKYSTNPALHYYKLIKKSRPPHLRLDKTLDMLHRNVPYMFTEKRSEYAILRLKAVVSRHLTWLVKRTKHTRSKIRAVYTYLV